MKKLFVMTVAFAFVLIFSLCGCQKSVDSSEITFEDMSLTLPNGDWYYGEDDNQYESSNCSITLIKTDDWSYRDNDRSFEFEDYGDDLDGHYPSCNFMYIDGYVAEFYSNEGGISVMIDYYDYLRDSSERALYILDADYIGDEQAAKDEIKAILSSIEFAESGKHLWIGMPWQDAISDIKPEETNGWPLEVVIQGEVADVTHEISESGKPFFIDLGNAYPDSERVTGVIWEEYQEFFDESELAALKGKEVLLMGETEMYDNILNIRIDDYRHIKPIYEIDDL